MLAVSCWARAVVVSARVGLPATAGPAGRSIVERTVVSMVPLSTLAIFDIERGDNAFRSVGCDRAPETSKGRGR